MMTCGLLQIENEEKDDVIGTISFQEKKTKIRKLQHTKRGPSKLVLTRSIVTYSGNYNALDHNYIYYLNVEGPAPEF
jgi:hypothetical protein